MTVYLGKDSHSATDDMTATQTTVTFDLQSWRLRTQNIYRQFLFIPKTFWWLVQTYNKFMQDCTTQQKRHAPWLWTKNLKLKRGDTSVKTRGDLIALAWKDRWEVYMPTNMGPPKAEGSFCDDSNCPVKPHIMEQNNSHMGYFKNANHMANSYSMSWPRNCFSNFWI